MIPLFLKTLRDKRFFILGWSLGLAFLGFVMTSFYTSFNGGQIDDLLKSMPPALEGLVGILFGVAGTGFVAGGILVAKFGLGKNPIRTLLRAVVVMGFIGAFFTIREWWLLFALGIWLYMILIPVIEAAEQTVIQRVVPFKKQGRVFGFAQALEAAAAPLTAFAIAPLAEFWIIPYMKHADNQASLSWLLGTGEARGIALVFLVAGLLLVAIALLAFASKTYQRLSATYQKS